jgi:cytochrome oxidase assembly protein ShyY1
VWQYGVSHQHKQDQVARLAHAVPRPLAEVMGPNDAFPGAELGRPVAVTGSWLPQGTVLVSGHRHDGQDGYWVASPVRVDGTGSAVYVVRGWTSSRDRVPAAPSGSTRLVGWLQPGDQSGAVDERPGDDVLPSLDISAALDHVDVDLFSAYVVGADRQAHWPAAYSPVNDGSAGLVDVPAPAPPKADATTGLRNFLYAIEWWLFAIFALYIWWRYVRDVTAPAPEGDDSGAPEQGAQEETVA